MNYYILQNIFFEYFVWCFWFRLVIPKLNSRHYLWSGFREKKIFFKIYYASENIESGYLLNLKNINIVFVNLKKKIFKKIFWGDYFHFIEIIINTQIVGRDRKSLLFWVIYLNLISQLSIFSFSFDHKYESSLLIMISTKIVVSMSKKNFFNYHHSKF